MPGASPQHAVSPHNGHNAGHKIAGCDGCRVHRGRRGAHRYLPMVILSPAADNAGYRECTSVEYAGDDVKLPSATAGRYNNDVRLPPASHFTPRCAQCACMSTPKSQYNGAAKVCRDSCLPKIIETTAGHNSKCIDRTCVLLRACIHCNDVVVR